MNIAPSVTLPASASATAGVALALTGSFTDPDTAQTWTASADFGDGTGDSVVLAADRTFSVRHTFSDAGSFSLVVTVTDSAGGMGSATTAVTVASAEPTSDPIGASFGEDGTTGVAIAEPGDTFSGNFTSSAGDLDIPARRVPLRAPRAY